MALSAVGGAAGYLAPPRGCPLSPGSIAVFRGLLDLFIGATGHRGCAILVYGLAGIVVAILGQAGTSVRGAYDVLVSLTVVTMFLPFLLLFAALIRLARRGAIGTIRCRGGAPVAIALAAVGFFSTAADHRPLHDSLAR